MFRIMITDESLCMLGMSERLSEYIVRAISDFSAEDNQDAHMMAIEISYMAYRILCDSYHGNDKIEGAIDRSDILLDGIIGSHIKA